MRYLPSFIIAGALTLFGCSGLSYTTPAATSSLHGSQSIKEEVISVSGTTGDDNSLGTSLDERMESFGEPIQLVSASPMPNLGIDPAPVFSAPEVITKKKSSKRLIERPTSSVGITMFRPPKEFYEQEVEQAIDEDLIELARFLNPPAEWYFSDPGETNPNMPNSYVRDYLHAPIPGYVLDLQLTNPVTSNERYRSNVNELRGSLIMRIVKEGVRQGKHMDGPIGDGAVFIDNMFDLYEHIKAIQRNLLSLRFRRDVEDEDGKFHAGLTVPYSVNARSYKHGERLGWRGFGVNKVSLGLDTDVSGFDVQQWFENIEGRLKLDGDAGIGRWRLYADAEYDLLNQEFRGYSLTFLISVDLK